jgi:N-acetylglucosaminyl-diphospho-decaprenol L-rhamnosyltransferase
MYDLEMSTGPGAIQGIQRNAPRAQDTNDACRNTQVTAALTLNFRKPTLTIRCVRCLLEDGWRPVLVWDNSEDGGKNAEALRWEFKGEPDVHVVASKLNIGFAAGVNRGLAWLRVHGERAPVLIINNDAEIHPGARVAMLAAFESSRRPALVAPLLHGGGYESEWLYYQPWFGLVTRRSIPGSVRYLSGCCLLVDCSSRDVPLLDEDFFMYGEDIELCRRLSSLDRVLEVVTAARVTHLGAASSGMASDFYEWHMVRAHWLLAAKLAPGPVTCWVWSALRLPSLLIRALVRCIRYRRLVPLWSLRAILCRR